MKRRWILLPFLLSLVLSCVTPPQQSEVAAPIEPVPPPAPRQEPIVEAPKEEEVFDPDSISQEMYENTKVDVQALVGNLNRIIRTRDYSGWTENLAESYLREISSQAFLEEKTEELYRRDQAIASSIGRDPRQVSKKILRTARDYFENVVVPSRSNDRVDDIEFISDNQVKAYTIDARGQRLVLYNLVIIDNQWKIIS